MNRRTFTTGISALFAGLFVRLGFVSAAKATTLYKLDELRPMGAYIEVPVATYDPGEQYGNAIDFERVGKLVDLEHYEAHLRELRSVLIDEARSQLLSGTWFEIRTRRVRRPGQGAGVAWYHPPRDPSSADVDLFHPNVPIVRDYHCDFGRYLA